jgi:formate hydrogenlyase transcriptional activator
MDGPAPERALLSAAVKMAGEVRVEGLAGRIWQALAELPGILAGGLAFYDEERELLHACLLSGDAQTAHTAVYARVNPPAAGLPEDGPPLPPELRDWLRAKGAAEVLNPPLQVEQRDFGMLVAGFESAAHRTGAARGFLHGLATLAAPPAWNCLTAERFARGDRRRDVLLELSHSINTSLQLDAVIEAAQRALCRLADEGVASINLLEPDSQHYRCYPAAGGAAPLPPARRNALDESLLVWVRQHRAVYLSPDLEGGPRFAEDAELQAAGMRRYAAVPLLARGHCLGALLIGWREPLPARQIDLWLYDNVALQLALALDNALQHEQLTRLSEQMRQQNVYLREEILSEHDFSELIGESPVLQRVRADIGRVAPLDTTVLITGETGVGKELVARAIHAASRRAGLPMVKLNCAAIPEGMVESELFGHERGAFTSAFERRIGRFELAHDGTLFLDEIGELPRAVQAKLLRVLQDGTFERVGGARTLTTNARIITATNRDLLAEVDAGRFRRDLYYRLNVFPLHVPALAQRREDIPLLVEHFIAHFSRRMGRRIEGISPQSLSELTSRPWPGNIRELRHVIERAMILSDGATLVLEPAGGNSPAAVTHPGNPGDRAAPPPPAALADVSPPPPSGSGTATINEVQAEHIRRVLIETNGIIEGPRGAARRLGLHPSTLRFRIKRLGIHPTRPRTQSHQQEPPPHS